MKALKVVLASLPVLLLAIALAAPLGPVPGFFIGGNAAKAPAQWGETSDIHQIMLKVPGTLPRVVTIWVVQHDGEMHVVGSKDSGWVSMIGEGAPVEMRLGDETYALQAAAVTEGWEPILEAYVAKYREDYPDIVEGFPTLEEAQTSVAVFRLNRN